MDSLLLPFLRSADEAEREQLLSDLIQAEVAPISLSATLRTGLIISPSLG
jgi:hypothetical protein